MERCRLLLHVVDVSGCEGRDPADDFEKINGELERFSPALAQRPQIVLGNKCDIAAEEQVAAFRAFVERKGLVFLPVSAATGKGLEALPGLVYNCLRELPPVEVFTPDYVKPAARSGREFTARREEDGSFYVDAPWLERILEGSNVEDYESLQYFQTQLADFGVLDKLVELGVKEGDTVRIGEYEFDYLF